MNSPPTLNIVLMQPEIPQNTGNIGRTCVAVGAKLWLVRPIGFKLDEKHLRRAGLDYWQHLQWEAVDDWQALTERLPVDSAWLFTKSGSRSYTAVRFCRGDVLVFGSESAGLPAELLAAGADRGLRIPMLPAVRCLNLANSVAVAAYEALRQFGG